MSNPLLLTDSGPPFVVGRRRSGRPRVFSVSSVVADFSRYNTRRTGSILTYKSGGVAQW